MLLFIMNLKIIISADVKRKEFYLYEKESVFCPSFCFKLFTCPTWGGGIVFAQSSNTNSSTAEIFSTDVDDYMDVNSWQGVSESTEKVFAFVNFNSSKLNLGAAKNFGSIWLGTYLNGYIPQITITNTESTASDSKTSTVTFDDGTTTGGSLAFNASVLLGMGDLGIKLDGTINPDLSNSKDTNPDSETDSSSSKYDVNLTAGYNTGSLTPHAQIGFSFYNDSSYSDATGSKITEDDGYKILYTSLGTGIDLGDDKSVDIGLTEKNYFYPSAVDKADDTVVTEQSRFRNAISLDVSYKAVYRPAEKVAVGFKIGGSLPFEIDNNKKTSLPGTALETVTTNTSTITIGLEDLEFDVGAQYFANEKLTINVGATASLGNLFTFSHENDELSSAKITTFEILPGKAYSLGLTTGFSYAFTPSVVLDTRFNIFKAATTSIYTSLDAIWNQGIYFELMFKL